MPRRENYKINDWFFEYRYAEPYDRASQYKGFGRYSELFDLKTKDIKDEYKGFAAAVGEAMKEVSKDLSEEMVQFDGHLDLTNSRGDNLREEDMPRLLGILYDKSLVMDGYEEKFTALQKAAQAMTTDAPLKLNQNEKAYLTSVLQSKGLDAKLLNEAGLRDAGYGDFKTVTFGRNESSKLNSLSDWRKAKDGVLKEAFEQTFKPRGVNERSLYKLGIEDYRDTIYIDGVSMKEYYKKNPLKEGTSAEADVMKKILNNSANIEVASFDAAYNVHTATVKAESGFPDKQGFFSKNTNAAENEKFKSFSETGAKARRADVEKAAGGLLTTERVSRALMFDKHEMMEEIYNGEQSASVNSLGKSSKLSQYVTIDPVEFQAYMLSKGLSPNEIIDPKAKQEQKAALTEEYRDLYRNRNSREGKQALDQAQAQIKESLAEQLVPNREMSFGNHIIENLDKISWLNKAAEYCEKNLSEAGAEKDTKAISDLKDITGAQIKYTKCFDADEFTLRPDEREEQPFRKIDESVRNKLFLEDYSAKMIEREAPILKDVLPEVHTSEYTNLLKGNMHRDFPEKTSETFSKDLRDCMGWLEDKNGRKAHIDFATKNLKFTAEKALMFPSADLYGDEFGIDENSENVIKTVIENVNNMNVRDFAAHDLNDVVDREVTSVNPRMKAVVANRVKEDPVYSARDKFLRDIGYKNGSLEADMDRSVAKDIGVYTKRDDDYNAVRSAKTHDEILHAEYAVRDKLAKNFSALNWVDETLYAQGKVMDSLDRWEREKSKDMTVKVMDVTVECLKNKSPYERQITTVLERDQEEIENEIKDKKQEYMRSEGYQKNVCCSVIKKFKDFIKSLTKTGDNVRKVSLSNVMEENNTEPKYKKPGIFTKTEPIKLNELEPPSMDMGGK